MAEAKMTNAADILIVDDEKPARDRLRQLVEDLGGHSIVGEAGNGADALRIAAEANPDIVLLDVRGQTTMTDYFVICSGASDRQLNAIADGIISGLKDDDVEALSREGEASSHWLLVDFGGVIVHVMSKPEREFYQLEKLWEDALLLVHVV